MNFLRFKKVRKCCFKKLRKVMVNSKEYNILQILHKNKRLFCLKISIEELVILEIVITSQEFHRKYKPQKQ